MTDKEWEDVIIESVHAEAAHDWYIDSIHCYKTNASCSQCNVSRLYGLAKGYDCKMPQTVQVLLNKRIRITKKKLDLYNRFYSNEYIPRR